MKDSQQYLIAKYSADVRRMELRNIGIILAAGDTVVSRFLSEEDAQFVNDINVYRRWVAYWNGVISGERPIPVNSAKIAKTDSRFMAELLKTQDGNYRLFDGGSVLDNVSAEDIDAAADYLFKELVSVEKKSVIETPHDQLKVTTNELMEAAGLLDREDFQTPYKVVCQIGRVQKPLIFDYAVIRAQKVRSVFQRVKVHGQQSVCSSAFMFEQLTESAGFKRKNCAALINADDDELTSDEIRSNIDLLEDRATIINVANYSEALDRVRQMAA